MLTVRRSTAMNSGGVDRLDQGSVQTSLISSLGESTSLWVVPSEAIIEIDEFVDELNRNYHRFEGYPLKVRLKEARERARNALVARNH